MAPYLLGFKCPAQCIEFEQKPMKVHVVPRSGASPQVCPAALAHPKFLVAWKSDTTLMTHVLRNIP